MITYFFSSKFDDSNEMWVHQDGAVPHNSSYIENYIQAILEHISDVNWPLRLCILSTFNIFMWGFPMSPGIICEWAINS